MHNVVSHLGLLLVLNSYENAQCSVSSGTDPSVEHLDNTQCSVSSGTTLGVEHLRQSKM